MNPSEFLGSQICEDPQNFIDEVKKIFVVIQVTGNDQVDLVSYQLKDVLPKIVDRGNNSRVYEFEAMVVQEYGLKFTQLSSYAPHMVVDSRPQMNNCMYEVSDLVKTECKNAMLLEDMNISRFMTHAQQVEGDKLREQAKENKKARIGNYDYS
uniref:Gag-pol polyprotein n=1 Tax=Solanum tuberosum TaxID=4113 RepID=M1DY50_SOLTU